MYLKRGAFKSHGRNFVFDPDGHYTFETIQVGNDVFLGLRPTMIASDSGIIIGNKVMFGPHVTIVGGNHNISVIGQYMYDVKEKRPEDDEVVVIEDDVWVGANATILKGVHLKRGCVVAAGALVTKSVPPYGIAVGVPAKVQRFRFTVPEILEHEKQLYYPKDRLTEAEITEIQNTYTKAVK